MLAFVYSPFTFTHFISSQGPTLVHYSTYTEAQLLPCMAKMAQLVAGMGRCKQQAVRNKYRSHKFLCVAEEARLRSKLVRDLAASAQ